MFIVYEPFGEVASLVIGFVFIYAQFFGIAYWSIAISGMSFLDINYPENNDVLVFLIHSLHFAQMAKKWRSRVASEEENNGLLAPELLQIRLFLAIKGF